MLTFDLIASDLNGKQNIKIPKFLMEWEIPLA